MTKSVFSQNDVKMFCDYILREYGLHYPPHKIQTLNNRLNTICNEFSCTSLSEMLKNALVSDQLRLRLLNCLTTNETWFFRHSVHFEILANIILPALVNSNASTKRKTIKIWSAGSSVGAELYSILITLHKTLKNLSNYGITLLGSDISSNSIARAKKGVFFKHEIEKLTDNQINQYFNKLDNEKYEIKNEFKRYINFEVLNLIDNWPKRNFDVIFCRNTMIYFDKNTKKKLTKRFYEALNPGGFYVTGINETLFWDHNNNYEQIIYDNALFYRKKHIENKQTLISFDDSTTLLRALNIFNKNNISFKLTKIDRPSELGPKREILIDSANYQQIKRLLSKIPHQAKEYK